MFYAYLDSLVKQIAVQVALGSDCKEECRGVFIVRIFDEIGIQLN